MICFYIPNAYVGYPFKIYTNSHDGRNDKQSISPIVAALDKDNNKRALCSCLVASILVLSVFTVVASSFLTLNPDANADNFQLPPGYKIEPVLWNLTTPGTVASDDKGKRSYCM
jgi:hypothetical protein